MLRRMQPTDEPGPASISWWRFLLMTALVISLYIAGRSIVTPPRTHPALLLPTVLLGGVLGVLVAKWEATGHNKLRGSRGHRRSASEARWYLFGLTGLGLVLSRVLPVAAWEWLLLGMAALGTGAASHAWMTARHHEQGAGVS